MRRERIEWVDIWVEGAEQEPAALPRVLLIGDSISRGYYGAVAEALRPVALCARVAGSRFVSDPIWRRELDLLLGDYAFSVIHVNNGLHGWDYTEADYAAALPAALDWLQARQPRARLVWAQSTPVRVRDDLARFEQPRHGRVLQRNADALTVMTARGVAVNDLMALALPHPDWHVPDGVHFNAPGNAALGAQVAATVRGALAG